ncbi:MAG: hypothetical protein M0Z30_10805 [Actinomycetota bacterium]|nr:hypothetical protein [Actinomycetota bacterium]
MAHDASRGTGTIVRARADTRVLYVAWQQPDRTITPVGRLTIEVDGTYEFRYLTRAAAVMGRPLTSFPAFDVAYRSERLFPFFENRMVPVARSDYADWAASVGLEPDADPFEVLASSGGPRATDTLEVFAPPALDRVRRLASGRILVRGVRHRGEAAQIAVDALRPGDRLEVRPEPTNDVDRLALLVQPRTGVPLGWIPMYLCPALHRSSEASGGDFSRVEVTVRHVGDRHGPSHFRLLCDVVFPWPFDNEPFDTPDFA